MGVMKTINVKNSRLFRDLVEFSGLPPKLVSMRCQYASAELSVLWRKRKSVEGFYKDNELYIFDLTRYQAMLEAYGHIRKMVSQIKGLGLRRVLEFGGGIGEFSIVCAEEGLDVSYFDLNGVIRDYALWRFAKHCAGVRVIEENPLDEEWDVVNVMDVLEHLENPEEVIAKLREKAKYIFCNPDEIKYDEFFAQHISRYDLTPYFEHVGGYLWRNKNAS